MPETNLIVVFLFGGVMAMAVGVLFGIPSLRIKGFYLAVATLASQFFLEWVFARVKWFTNYTPSGSVAVGNLEVFGMEIQSPEQKYLFVLAIVVRAHVRRQEPDPRAARPHVDGHPRHGHRRRDHRHPAAARQAVGVRGVVLLIGVAGALWAFLRLGSWEPLAFDINRSFQILFMVIIGGLGSLLGSFLGAAFIVLTPIFLNQVPGLFSASRCPRR